MTFPLGTGVGAPVVPGGFASTYPTHFDGFGAGGWRTVYSFQERDATPVDTAAGLHYDGLGSGRRRVGMAVVVAVAVENPATWLVYRLLMPAGFLLLNDAGKLAELANNNNWYLWDIGTPPVGPPFQTYKVRPYYVAYNMASDGALGPVYTGLRISERRAADNLNISSDDVLVLITSPYGVSEREAYITTPGVDDAPKVPVFYDFATDTVTVRVVGGGGVTYTAGAGITISPSNEISAEPQPLTAAAILARIDRPASNVVVEISPNDSDKLIFNIKRSGILIPAINEFRYNRTADTLNAPGYVRKDSIAIWGIYTTATSLKIRGKANIETMYLPYASFNVLVNGNLFTTVSGFTQADIEQLFTVSGLPSGNKLVEICEGGQYRVDDNPAGPIRFIQFTSVTLPLGFTASVADVSPSDEAVVVLGNSRSVGGIQPVSVLTSFAGILRRQRNSDVYLTGFAQLRMAEHIIGNAKQDALVVEFSEHLDGYTTQKIILGPDCFNDWGAGIYSPADLLTGYLQLITKLRAAVPNAKIFIGCTFSSRYAWGGANALGFNQQEYYNMEKSIAANFPSNVFTLDFMAAGLTSADYEYDDTHLTATGDAKMAAYINTVFNAS